MQLVAVGPGESGKNRECSATGFLVNDQGYILTNAHVVENAKRCLTASPRAKILAKLAPRDARTAAAFSCDVVAVDDAHDLAVLKPQRRLEAPTRFLPLDPGPVTKGAAVFVIGHPEFSWRPVTHRTSVVGRARTRLSDHEAESSDVLLLDMALETGSSGGPVCRETTGGVVGIVERRDAGRPARTVAVEVRHAIELLDRHDIRWHAPTPP